MTKHFSGLLDSSSSSLSIGSHSNTQSTRIYYKMCFRNIIVMAILPLLTLSTTYHSSTPLLRSNTRSPKLDTVPPDPLPYAPSRITQSLNKFSNRLYNVMNEYRGDEEDGVEDLVYSPVSVYTSLVTVRSGSRFETTQELSTVLSLGKVNDSVVEAGLSGVLSSYSGDGGARVGILNRLFLDHSYHPSSSYHQKVNDKFGGQLVQTEFSNATAASEFVNAHVYEASDGVLQDIISVDLGEGEGVTESSGNITVENVNLSIDGGLMLISGMTMEGDWARPFTPMLTRQEDFVREDGGVSRVEMMHRDGVYEIAEIEELNGTVLSLPYKSHRFSLNVVLPVEGVRVGEVEENLESFPCIAVLSRLKKGFVQVSLPRFQVETTVDLIEPLEKMGVRRVFSEEGADFGRVVGGGWNPGLYLTNVVSKSVLDVSEGGSRVRGANFVEAIPAQARVLTPFTVNRPFVFFVADRVLNTVVLVGRKVL